MKRLSFSDAAGTRTVFEMKIEDDGTARVAILSSGATERVISTLDHLQVRRLRDALIVETA